MNAWLPFFTSFVIISYTLSRSLSKNTFVRMGCFPGRQFVDHGKVEVRIDGHRQRPRNRGCRHEQDVGTFALFPQRRSLHHPEPVLLVNHGQAEAPEFCALLDKGMRADDYIDFAGFDLAGRPFLSAPFLLPVTRAALSPRISAQRSMFRKCWFASISVGAMMAD